MQNDRINRFDIAIECLLYALLAFMPLALGAVQAWSQQVVIGLSALMAACFFAKLVSDRRTPVTFTWIYLPLIVFCLMKFTWQVYCDEEKVKSDWGHYLAYSNTVNIANRIYKTAGKS